MTAGDATFIFHAMTDRQGIYFQRKNTLKRRNNKFAEGAGCQLN